jgi:hypothetical protein
VGAAAAVASAATLYYYFFTVRGRVDCGTRGPPCHCGRPAGPLARLTWTPCAYFSLRAAPPGHKAPIFLLRAAHGRPNTHARPYRVQAGQHNRRTHGAALGLNE